MSIIELINSVGQENISVQFLAECISGNINTSQKTGVTKFTVGTKEVSCGDLAFGTGKMGVILWLPRDKLPQPQASNTEPAKK